MSIHIKICGITDAASAWAAVEAGADSVGFVLAPSVREITPIQAAAIASKLPPHIEKVAVFGGPSIQDIEQALGEFAADVVQADFPYLKGLPSPRLLPVFREKLADHSVVGSEVDGGRFVYEGRHSGVGQTVDWDAAMLISRLGQMTLAGGLNPDNVVVAIRTVGPFGVDVSSGVESAPGVKDPMKIRAFVQAVREGEKDLVTT